MHFIENPDYPKPGEIWQYHYQEIFGHFRIVPKYGNVRRIFDKELVFIVSAIPKTKGKKGTWLMQFLIGEEIFDGEFININRWHQVFSKVK